MFRAINMGFAGGAGAAGAGRAKEEAADAVAGEQGRDPARRAQGRDARGPAAAGEGGRNFGEELSSCSAVPASTTRPPSSSASMPVSVRGPSPATWLTTFIIVYWSEWAGPPASAEDRPTAPRDATVPLTGEKLEENAVEGDAAASASPRTMPITAEGLVDGARVLGLFGDVATELLIRRDGDEGAVPGVRVGRVPRASPRRPTS